VFVGKTTKPQNVQSRDGLDKNQVGKHMKAMMGALQAPGAKCLLKKWGPWKIFCLVACNHGIL
jgi:hypothetical protein